MTKSATTIAKKPFAERKETFENFCAIYAYDPATSPVHGRLTTEVLVEVQNLLDDVEHGTGKFVNPFDGARMLLNELLKRDLVKAETAKALKA